MKTSEIIIGVVALSALLVLMFTMPKHGVKIYDCSLAEISPDYPTEVKNECRKARVTT
jgi:hypothetical protein